MLGVVASTLDNITLQKVGIQSQNVNFGIRSSILNNVLEAHELVFSKDIGEQDPIKATKLLECFGS